jgi:hypothetical protein
VEKILRKIGWSLGDTATVTCLKSLDIVKFHDIVVLVNYVHQELT